MKNKSILGLILAILLSGGAVGGYKVVHDNKADTFENSLHAVTHVVDKPKQEHLAKKLL